MTDQTQPDHDTADAAAGESVDTLAIQRFPEKIAVIRLAPGADIPEWAESSSLFSITATATETTLVCAGRNVPTKAQAVRGLIGFALDQRIAPTSVGVVMTLLAPMAEEDIAVFTFTTYDSTWVLVPSADAERATEAWRRQGHSVEQAVPVTPGSDRSTGKK